MDQTKDELLKELSEIYSDLGVDLYLLTALMAYESAFASEEIEEVAETSEACILRLSDYIAQRAREILRITEVLNPQVQ